MPDNTRKAAEMAALVEAYGKAERDLSKAADRAGPDEYDHCIRVCSAAKQHLLTALQASATRPVADPDEAVLREHGHTKAACPDCGAPGFNTEFGFWQFECGAEILTSGEVDTPCPGATSPSGQEARHEGR